MMLHDLVPELSKLSRAEKLQVIQFLVSELAKEENLQLVPDQAYPAWTPYDSFEAAQTLLDFLNAERNKDG